MRNLLNVVVLGVLSGALAQVASAEQHTAYAKKMLIIKNCSPHTLQISAVQSLSGEQPRVKHASVGQFKLFQSSDTPVKELHVTLDTEEKIFRNVEAGDYTLRVLRNPHTEKWRFTKQIGASC